MTTISSNRLSWLTCLALLGPASVWSQELPTVAKPLQRKVELTCRLDVFTPMLYEGITTELGGSKTTLTFNKSCAELEGREYSVREGKAPIHAKSLMEWSAGWGNEVRVGNQTLSLNSGDLRKTLRVIPLGRMSLVDFGGVGHIYDNTEQHWCPFAFKFPAGTTKATPLYWYDKNSQNVIRFYQGAWAGPISKTQHHLPAACSSSQTPMPQKPILFKMGKDIPVNVHKGPVVVTY